MDSSCAHDEETEAERCEENWTKSPSGSVRPGTLAQAGVWLRGWALGLNWAVKCVYFAGFPPKQGSSCLQCWRSEELLWIQLLHTNKCSHYFNILLEVASMFDEYVF